MRWDTPHASWDSGTYWDRSVNPVGMGDKPIMQKLLITFERLSLPGFLAKVIRPINRHASGG